MTQWGLDNLFNPGKRHMDDEKRRLQSTREEIGDASGGRRIDLEAGKVSIKVRRPTDVAADEPDEVDDTALEPALEAEDLPAVALANDEMEIEPEVVDDAADIDTGTANEVQSAPVESVAAVEAVATDAPAETPTEESSDEPAPAPAAVADDVPIEAPAPEPVTAAPRKRQLSANAWSRRG